MVTEPGDLLTQPNWTWHDHNNFSNEPMIWLDGLDAKLVQYLDANFHENWAEDATQPLIRSSEEPQQRLTAVRSPSYKPPGRRNALSLQMGRYSAFAGGRGDNGKCRSL